MALKMSNVDELSGDEAAIPSAINGGAIELKPFAVSLIVLGGGK